MTIIFYADRIEVELDGLTEEEHRRLMELCFGIGMRQETEADTIKVKDGMVSLTTNNERSKTQ